MGEYQLHPLNKITAQKGINSNNTQVFLDWVKDRSHLLRGAAIGTIMRGDVLWFIRLGTFIERADNTARILDVKYRVIKEDEDSIREFYRWNVCYVLVASVKLTRVCIRVYPVNWLLSC